MNIILQGGTSTIGSTNILTSATLFMSNPAGNGDVTGSIAIGQTSFQGPANTVEATGSITWTNADGSTIDMFWFDDPTNQQGAETPFDRPGNQVYTDSDTAVGILDSFSTNSGILPVNDPGAFSMTVAFRLLARGWWDDHQRGDE